MQLDIFDMLYPPLKINKEIALIEFFGGCGCCGSPYLEYEDNKYIERIVYNFNLNEIFVEGSGFRHERPDLFTEEEIKKEKILDDYLEEIVNEGNKEKDNR